MNQKRVFWWQRCSLCFGFTGGDKSCYIPLRSHLIAGEPGAMVSSTLKLGISILNGGNSDVQQVRKPSESITYAKIKHLDLCDKDK